MANVIRGTRYAGFGNTINGNNLADALLELAPETWPDYIVDMRGCRPGAIGSGLIKGFFQRIHDLKPELLEAAKAIRWEFTYEFQEEIFDLFRKNFLPYGTLRPRKEARS